MLTFIHYASEDVLEVTKQAYLMYFSVNGLGLRAFGSLERFESEVVAMGLSQAAWRAVGSRCDDRWQD